MLSLRTRTLICLIALSWLYAAGPAYSVDVDSTSGGLKHEPDVIIYRGTYPAWPWVTSTPDGRKLVAVWREGTRHDYCADGRLMLSESTDGGKTWSAARVFHDEPGVDDRNVAIVALSEKDWLVSYNIHTRDDHRQVMIVRTRDGGVHWSAPTSICELDAASRAAPIRLSTGRLVVPFYLVTPESQSVAAYSDDDGVSWTVSRIPNHSGFQGDEWDVCELPDGRLVGMIRNNVPRNEGYLYRVESRDLGQTWGPAVKTNVRDNRSRSPAQIFMHRGVPVVLYSYKREIAVAMATTEDPQLIEWKVDSRMHCYHYRAHGKKVRDAGYPVSVSIGGNKRFIVDYCNDGEDKWIAGYEVELPESWNRRNADQAIDAEN